MAKLTAFTLVFAALFALSALSAHSATYTTTVVTTTTAASNEANPMQMCESEIRRMRMTHCMQYMKSGMGGRYEPFLRSAVANPERFQEEHLEECCEELGNVRSECRRSVVGQMMKQMKQQYGSQEMEMLSEKARALPQKCNFRQY